MRGVGVRAGGLRHDGVFADVQKDCRQDKMGRIGCVAFQISFAVEMSGDEN